jgi:hypothetical protein
MKTASAIIAQTIIMLAGVVLALICVPIWMGKASASPMGWIAGIAAVLGAGAVAAPHAALLLLKPTTTDKFAYVVGGLSLPLFAAAFLLAKSWYPKQTLLMATLFSLSLAMYVAGYMIRVFMPVVDEYPHYAWNWNNKAGTGLVIAGTVCMAIMGGISQHQRTSEPDFVVGEDGLVKPTGVSYGSI